MKGLVDPENIGHNSEYDQHLTSASPPSENNIRHLMEPRFHNRQIINDRYDENESDSMNKDFDSINDIENRAELSPNFDDHQIRKRRKDSSCDNNSLPHKRHQSESRVSLLTCLVIQKKKYFGLGIIESLIKKGAEKFP